MRRAAVGVLAGTLTLTGATIAAGVSPANAVEGFAFERLAGADRYGTAAAIARDAFPGGTDTAIIARGDVFADALTANYLAGVVDAPILLTASTDLPKVTADALAALGVENVIIVGGRTAVSAGVEAELSADYDVERFGGADRYLTAELIATEAASLAPVGESDGLATAVLASGQDFPDALALGPIAYAGNHPLLITRPGDLPASTERVLNDLNIEQVVIAGQTAAVSAAVETEVEGIVGNDAIRLGGQTRFETATIIAEAAYADFGFDDTHVNLARADSPLGFADALTGGPHAGMELAPIVLTNPTALPPATRAFLEDNCPTLEDGHIFGGPVAVSPTVEADAEAAAASCSQNATVTAAAVDGGEFVITVTGDDVESVTVTGDCIADQTFAVAADEDAAAAGNQFTVVLADDAAAGDCVVTVTTTFTAASGLEDEVDTITVTVPAVVLNPNENIDVQPDTPATLAVTDTGATETSTADNRSFTVTGLDNGEEYRITLVECGQITRDADGNAVFAFNPDQTQADGDELADVGTPDADIIAVNGVTPTNNTGEGTATTAVTNSAVATPVNGSITFTIDGDTPECVVPVVYDNGGPGQTVEQGGDSPRLELGSNGQPVQAFGIGGETTFVNPAAATGDTAGLVQSVNKGANQFDANDRTFTFDANDTFTIGTTPSTLDEFEAALSSGDSVTVNFSANPAASSSFSLTDNNPTNPTAAPTATAGTGANSNDITVSTTVVGDADTVQFQRATVTNGVPGTFATIATEPATDDDAVTPGVQVVFVDNNVPAGTFQFRVIVTNDGDVSEASPASAPVTSTAPAADSAGPQSDDARVSTDSGFAGTADAGDVFTFVFDEALSVPAAGATLRIQDADGTVVDVMNGTNATFTLNAAAVTFLNGEAQPAGEVLTVTLTGAPTVVAAGTTAGLQYGATTVVANSSGVNDLAGNRYDIAGSADKSLNVAANVVTAPAAGDTTAPLATDATFNQGVAGIFGNSDGTVVRGDGTLEPADVIAITYNEAVVAPANGATVTISNGTTTGTYTCGTNVSCTVSSNGLVLTITVTNSAATDVAIDGTGDSVTGTTGVADAAGNAAAGYPEPLNA